MKKFSHGHYLGFFSFLVMTGGIYYFFFSIPSEKVEYISARLEESESVLPQALPLPKHLPTPEPVRGIYMTSWVAGTSKWRGELVEFVKKTELNTIVIDVKDYSGRVAFDTGDPTIKEIGSEEKRVPDMREFIDKLHKDGIYTIARITVFQDPFYSKKFPASAVKTKSNAIWKDKNNLSYVDPSAKDFWDYIIALARASEKAGFDELQFDYIRFPSDGNISDAIFPLSAGKSKEEALGDFFSYLRDGLKNGRDPVSVPISADIFGMTTTNRDDLGIGQVLENIDEYFDYISPMVYPSHYPPTYMGLKNPAEHPYEVIVHGMNAAAERLTAASSSPKKLRPWIQDFNLGATYDAHMINLEKKAIYDAELTSWLAWDASNRYTRDAYFSSE